MDEQVNIPALGIVCYWICISKILALYGYTSRKGETKASAAVK
jgi:hypothetical protein